jgi:hypothetical protein
MARRPAARAVLAVAGVVALAAVYVFLATAGRMTRFPHIGHGYYEQLAVAFADGHVDLVQRPDPATSAEDVREQYWDLSLHHGRLYLYWGPVPALIGAALLRWFAISVPDDPLTIAFALARTVLGAMLLVRAKRHFFRGHAWWPTWMGVATLAFGAPLTLISARPAVYEAAIVSGQCFLVAATYVAFVALTRPRGPITRPLLCLAGICLALGVASRLAQLLAAVGIAALTLAETAGDAPKRGRLRFWLLDATALGAPLVAGLGGLGAYNRARFGSVFDTGLRHQLSQWTFHNGFRFVLPNLYSYIAKPPGVVPHFPFIRAAGWDGCPLWTAIPELSLHGPDYLFEANVGFLWTTPFYAFALIAWLALARWALRSAWRRSLAPSAMAPRLAWLVAASFMLSTVSMIPCLVAFVSAARYLADATAGLALGATLGLSLLAVRPVRSRVAHGALAVVVGAAVVVSIVVNLALWVEGPYGDFLHSQNGALFERLSHAFSRSSVRCITDHSG